MHPQTTPPQKQVFRSMSNIRASQIFYNIADEDMSGFFMHYIQEKDECQSESNAGRDSSDQNKQKEKGEQNINDKEVINQKEQVELFEETEQYKLEQHAKESQQQVVSRLQIEVKKNSLDFIPVYGQIFIMIINAQLLSDQRKESGKLLVTNYRFAFFKGRVKKLDLPYGFIAECKYTDKNCEIVCRLKYDHFWKLKIVEEKNFANLKIFLQIYLKIQSIRSCFAYSYALKYPQQSKIKHNQIINQFTRLNFTQNPNIHIIDNTDFIICPTYPELIYVPIKITVNLLAKVVKFWHEGRVPVMVYSHLPVMQQFGAIWRAASLVCERTEELKELGKYLDYLRNKNQKLFVFDSGFKALKKGLEEFQVFSQCQMKYLQAESLQNIRLSYIAMVQCFLTPKKIFIKDLLASKWYDGVLQFLKGASEIARKVLNNENVLIKCNDGRDKSAVFSALTQIIINPYYRTFNGFSILVQKQFQFFGHPFLNRLGLSTKRQEQSPIFIMFLDCVGQLISHNEMCFEFNHKYLSKLSNLMYTCLFGTFITNTRKQSLQNCVLTETVPIWNQLVSQLTSNAYYYQKSGILEIPANFDDIRIWKEHFWYLTTAPKESYKIHPLAQDNLDYINLNCHKVMNENKQLQHEISQQKKIIQSLKAKILARQEQTK